MRIADDSGAEKRTKRVAVDKNARWAKQEGLAATRRKL